MPKRVIDGEALWTSVKLSQVNPPRLRAEYANMLPLALANGVFEANPRQVWMRIYGYNRPDITVEDVVLALSEYERTKLLFRWQAEGKVWGFWIGIDKPGRLPKPSDLKKMRYAVGPDVPQEALRDFLTRDNVAILTREQGDINAVGMGNGTGIGNGNGTGRIEQAPLVSSDEDFDSPVRGKEGSGPVQAAISVPPSTAASADVQRLCEALALRTGNPVTEAWSAPAREILDSYSLELALGVVEWMYVDEKAAKFWPQRTWTMQNLRDHLFRRNASSNGKQAQPALITQYSASVRQKNTSPVAERKTEQGGELTPRLQKYLKRGPEKTQ